MISLWVNTDRPKFTPIELRSLKAKPLKSFNLGPSVPSPSRSTGAEREQPKRAQTGVVRLRAVHRQLAETLQLLRLFRRPIWPENCYRRRNWRGKGNHRKTASWTLSHGVSTAGNGLSLRRSWHEARRHLGTESVRFQGILLQKSAIVSGATLSICGNGL